MSADFNADLDKALDILYDYAKNFKISIELIQKLSQQLKLDTFIDTDAYSHILDQPLKDDLGNTIKFQRLSIAGSLILIDIDFVDATIYRVSFSSASQLDAEDNSSSMDTDMNGNFKLPKIDKLDEINIININFNDKNINSLLNSGKLESILLFNLQKLLLDNFPANLKYLANLDKLSTTATDLFSYSDHIGLLLNCLYQIELQNNSDNWLIKQGLTNSVGRVLFNNDEKIGIFIEYWQDFRYINHGYQLMKENANENINNKIQLNKDNLLLGKNYNILLDINSSHFTSSIDYIGETREEIWELINGKFQFSFTDESYLVPNRVSSTQKVAGIAGHDESIKFQPKWNLFLNLNHAIYLPINILEFVGINHFEEIDTKEYNFFEKLNDEKEITLINENLNISIKSEIHSKFIPIKKLSIKKLVDIPSFLRIFRNQLVLTNLLYELVLNCNENKLNEHQNVEIKENLKKSLKLSNDINDDQILNLKSLNNFNNTDDDILLNDFMDESHNTTNDNNDDSLIIKINDISYDHHDIMISINGKITKKIDMNFKISNGEIKLLENDLKMVDELQESFVKALNHSEDIINNLKLLF